MSVPTLVGIGSAVYASSTYVAAYSVAGEVGDFIVAIAVGKMVVGVQNALFINNVTGHVSEIQEEDGYGLNFMRVSYGTATTADAVKATALNFPYYTRDRAVIVLRFRGSSELSNYVSVGNIDANTLDIVVPSVPLTKVDTYALCILGYADSSSTATGWTVPTYTEFFDAAIFPNRFRLSLSYYTSVGKTTIPTVDADPGQTADSLFAKVIGFSALSTFKPRIMFI